MKKRKILITGGAGFIGSNVASFYHEKGDEVYVVDNFSRKGTLNNARWLREKGVRHIITADLRNWRQIDKVLEDIRPDIIFHEAAQVAVTTSIQNPRHDFDNNLLATFNILEAVRDHVPEAIFIFASTNKVYGSLEDIPTIEEETRYHFDHPEFGSGISEERGLDFHSPYGCSKGAADQYVRDYSRLYGLKSVVFRQSCIYGPRQFGVEDQGWVAWFIISVLLDKPLTIYGNGKQVRDLLHVDDLIAAYDQAIENIDQAKGHVYNMGGGKENTLSLLELIHKLEEITGKNISYSFAPIRAGDQKMFIADTSKAEKKLGWRPKIDVHRGVVDLHDWLKENLDMVKGATLLQKGMTETTFSIIVPTYNEELDIQTTLTALEKIQYPYFEVIVVDDASTDRTVEIVTTFTKRLPNFTLLQQEKNQGVSAARNRGILEAQGKVMVILNADVVLPSDFLAKLAPYYEQGLDWVAVPSRVLNQETPYSRYTEAGEHVNYLSGKGHWVWSEGFSCTKEAALGVGLFPEAMPGASGEDVDFGLNLEKNYKGTRAMEITATHIAPDTLKGFYLQNKGRGKGRTNYYRFIKHYSKLQLFFSTLFSFLFRIVKMIILVPLLDAWRYSRYSPKKFQDTLAFPWVSYVKEAAMLAGMWSAYFKILRTP